MIENLLIVRKCLVHGEGALSIHEKRAIGADPWLVRCGDQQATQRACWSVVQQCLHDDLQQHLVKLGVGQLAALDQLYDEQ